MSDLTTEDILAIPGSLEVEGELQFDEESDRGLADFKAKVHAKKEKHKQKKTQKQATQQNNAGPGFKLAIVEARNLLGVDGKKVLVVTVGKTSEDQKTSDPFVVITGFSTTFKTKTVKRNVNPMWDETFLFQTLDPLAGTFNFRVFDWDLVKPDPIGLATFDMRDLRTDLRGDRWIPVDKGGELHIRVLGVTVDGRELDMTPSKPTKASAAVLSDLPPEVLLGHIPGSGGSSLTLSSTQPPPSPATNQAASPAPAKASSESDGYDISKIPMEILLGGLPTQGAPVSTPAPTIAPTVATTAPTVTPTPAPVSASGSSDGYDISKIPMEVLLGHIPTATAPPAVVPAPAVPTASNNQTTPNSYAPAPVDPYQQAQAWAAYQGQVPYGQYQPYPGQTYPQGYGYPDPMQGQGYNQGYGQPGQYFFLNF